MGATMDRVGCARFLISASDQTALMQWRTRLSAQGAGLEAALERGFAGITPPDEVLVIDRLEVDLGTLRADDLDLEQIVQATRAALESMAIAAPLRTRLPQARAGPAPHTALPDAAFRVALPRSAAATLITYLATGTLDPRAPVPDLPALYAVLVPDAATAGLLARFVVTAPPRQRRAALLRLFATGPRALVQTLLSAAFPELPDWADAPQTPSPKDVLPRYEDVVALARAVDKAIATAPAPVADASIPEQEHRDAEAVAPRYTCANAGLVLLHPLLVPYFEGIGLIEGRDFVDDTARAIAARLLHYIATGEAEAEEPDLTLPRYLCAVPADVALLPLVPLDPDHIAEAARMIDAFIAAWQGIGNITPEGMRQSFLSRPGVMDGPADAPRLTVERSGIDILLTRLPWTLSLIRLPWMTAPLKVDWA